MQSSWVYLTLLRVWVPRSRKLSSFCTSLLRRRLQSNRDSDRLHLFRLDTSFTLFTPSSLESRVVLRCACAVVVLLLHRLGPYPFDPPTIDFHSQVLAGVMAPDNHRPFFILLVVFRFAFFSYSIRLGVDVLVVLYCKLFTEQRWYNC